MYRKNNQKLSWRRCPFNILQTKQWLNKLNAGRQIGNKLKLIVGIVKQLAALRNNWVELNSGCSQILLIKVTQIRLNTSAPRSLSGSGVQLANCDGDAITRSDTDALQMHYKFGIPHMLHFLIHNTHIFIPSTNNCNILELQLRLRWQTGW